MVRVNMSERGILIVSPDVACKRLLVISNENLKCFGRFWDIVNDCQCTGNQRPPCMLKTNRKYDVSILTCDLFTYIGHYCLRSLPCNNGTNGLALTGRRWC